MSDIASTDAADIALTPRGERYATNHENAEYFAKLKALRKEAVAEIERLLKFLDDLDGDPDLEEDGTAEPSLGWSGAGSMSSSCHDDREVDDSDDEDDGSGEPSLGAPESVRARIEHWMHPDYSRTPCGSQEAWARGNRRDLEEEVGQDNREAVDAE